MILTMREKSDASGKKDSDDSNSNNTSVSCLQTSEISYKAYYFLFYGAIGSSVPYLALYFKQLGLSAAQAGLLHGVRLFSLFIGAPVWGMIGDKYKIRKTILFLSSLSYSTGTLLLLAAKPQNQQCIETGANRTVIHPLRFPPGGGIVSSGESSASMAIDSQSPQRLNNMSHVTIFTREVDKSELGKIFMTFLSILFSCQILGSVVYTMPDALVVGFLQENADKFGHLRMWGEVGVASGSFVVGGVISLYQSEVCGETVKNYHISFYFFAGFVALSLVTMIFMEAKYSDDETSPRSSIWSLVKELLLCHNVIFVTLALYLGMLMGLQDNFGLWYLDDLGAQPYMLGMASGFRYTLAILGYFTSGMIINKIGLAATLAVCLAFYVAVYMGLAFVLNPWIGVVLYSSHGTIYGLAWSACVVFGAKVSLKVGFYSVLQGTLST